MVQRTIRTVLPRVPALLGTLGLLLAVLATGPAEAAKYRYGKYRTGSAGGGQGFYIYLEGGVANPRNTDTVFATSEVVQNFGGGVNTVQLLTPGWDDEVTGRFALGYRWAGGNRLELRAWNYEADTAAAFTGDAAGVLHFAVGPPICTAPAPGGCTDYVGDAGTPGFVNLTNEISATAIDALWARSEELGDAFTVEWALGGRFVEFEETFVGSQGDNVALPLTGFSVNKINTAEYFGVRAAVRGSYAFTSSISVGGGLGFSFLDGEIDASARQTPLDTGSGVPAALATVFDDGRSASIVEIDVRASWRSASDRFEISVGWEQSQWNDLTADLVRNLPGTTRPLADRDEIVFSGFFVGVGVNF